MHDKKYIYRNKHKQVMQSYTSKETFYIHLLQYHVVLLESAVCGTLMQDSVWYHLLQPEHSIQRVFGSSGILQTQYTGTSSTDLTVDSVARLSFLYGNIDICLLSKQLHRWRHICQCSSKCHSKEAAVIPPCLHLNIHELQVDCW